MLVIVGASGKLGFATLNALLEHNLVPPTAITCTTSSTTGAAKLEPAKQKGVTIKSANWDDDHSTWTRVLQGCQRLFLISSSRVERDFWDAEQGRETDHFRVLEAAQAVGVKHVYYTSLAFANPSKSRVMKAHERTEAWLAQKSSPMQYTIIREGLYNESWPLYLGHYDIDGLNRTEVKIAGDCKINWTSIPDLGLATALILSKPGEEASHRAGRVITLAQEKAHSLVEVCAMVSKAKGKSINVQIGSRSEHENFYIQEKKMDEGFVKWWSKTYDALNEGECEIHDSALEELLATKGIKPTPMEDTVANMLQYL